MMELETVIGGDRYAHLRGAAGDRGEAEPLPKDPTYGHPEYLNSPVQMRRWIRFGR